MTSTLRCLRVLELLAEQPYDLSVSDVGSRLSIGKASAHRLLATLVKGGFVGQEPVSRRYRLAGKALWVGAGFLRYSQVYRASFLVMQELSKKVDAMVHLAVWDDDMALFLYSEGYPTTMQMFLDVGDRRPLNATAVGKAMLAYSPTGILERVMGAGTPPCTRYTITSLPAMKQELERTRKRGYAVADQEVINGIRAVACPIRGQDGAVLGAISVANTRDALAGKTLDKYAALLQEATLRVSMQLGYRASMAGPVSENGGRRLRA